jgi:glycosyltransferase involved in cell wall biosynthesis
MKEVNLYFTQTLRKQSSEQAAKWFIYVGNAYPHKNLKRLIEAMVNLNKKVKENIQLYIVSSRNVFTKRLEKLIKDLRAEDYIKLLGFVPDDKLIVLYQKSLAFVFPSISEGFGLPGLEAMNSQTLVACSDIPVFKEIYKDVPIYFNPFDVNSISDSMKLVLEMDPEAREKKIEKGLTLAKTYSWAKMAKETLKVYESCFSL